MEQSAKRTGNGSATTGRHGLLKFFAVFMLPIAVVVTMDVLVGLKCRDGEFRGMLLPPYDLLFTERQRARLLTLGTTYDPGGYGQFDPDLGWALKSNYTGDFGPNNSAAFRASREYPLDVPTGTTRVAAFGDSYTHSGTINSIEETWTYQLESSRPNLEVLNFGVSGYGTDQAYLRYMRDGEKYQPEVVLIGLMLENLMRNVSIYRPAYYHNTGGIGVKPRFNIDNNGELQLIPSPAKSARELKDLIESRQLIDRIRETDYWVRRSPLAYDGSPFFASSLFRIAYAIYENRRPLASYYENRSSEPFKVTLEVIRNFQSRALDNGADRVLVIIFPAQRDLQLLRKGKPRYWQTMVDALQAINVPVIDMSDPLLEAIGDSHPREYFSKGHYNEAGEAVVAKTLLLELF